MTEFSFWVNYPFNNKYKKHVYACLLHHHVVPIQTCMHFFLLWEKKDDILKNAGNQTFSVPIDFRSILCSYNGTETVWLQIFFKISSFMFHRRKRVRFRMKIMSELSFLVYYSIHFKIIPFILVTDCNVHIAQHCCFHTAFSLVSCACKSSVHKAHLSMKSLCSNKHTAQTLSLQACEKHVPASICPLK